MRPLEFTVTAGHPPAGATMALHGQPAAPKGAYISLMNRAREYPDNYDLLLSKIPPNDLPP